MTRKEKDLTQRPNSPDYEVGFGRPPKTSQFKPGRSGNPRGRLPGSKNKPRDLGPLVERFKEMLLSAAYAPMTTEDGNETNRVDEITRSMLAKAAEGSVRHQKLFFDLLTGVEKERKEERRELAEVALKYKKDWQAEFESESRAMNGNAASPRADHVQINRKTLEVLILDTDNPEQVTAWNQLADLRDEARKQISVRSKALSLEKNLEKQEILRDLIDSGSRLLSDILDIIGDYRLKRI